MASSIFLLRHAFQRSLDMSAHCSMSIRKRRKEGRRRRKGRYDECIYKCEEDCEVGLHKDAAL